MAGKYLSVGSVTENEFDGKKNESIQLDNVALKQFIEFIKKHGETYLKGLTDDEIRAAQKLPKDDPNKIPRLRLYVFNKTDQDYQNGCPTFITKGISIKKE